MLRQELRKTLEAQLDQGTVLQTDYRVSREGDLLCVTLLAQCTEQIGRVVAMEDVQDQIIGPQHPLKPTETDRNSQETKDTEE